MTDSSVPDPANRPNLLTIREVADILRVHPRTVYRLVQESALAAIRVGTQWRVPENALHAYIDSGWKQWRPDPARQRGQDRERQHKLPL